MAYQRKNAKPAKESNKPVWQEIKDTPFSIMYQKDGEHFAIRMTSGKAAIQLYGCKVIDGKNGAFISAPAQKGKDGNYYPQGAIYLEEYEEAVMSALCSDVPF